MATPPGSSQAPAGRGAAPGTVTVATMLVGSLVGLLVLRAVLTYALFDSLIDHWYESRRSSTLPREIVAEGAPAYRPIALVSAIVIGGGLAVCAAFAARGAGWARIAVTVFGFLGFAAGMIGLLQPSTVLFKLFGLVMAVVAMGAVVLLWLPASSAFFRARKATGVG